MNRILVLTARYPYPVIGGDRLRIYHICKALSRRYELTLASLCENPDEMRHRPTDGLFHSIHRVYLPRWKSYANAFRALASRSALQLAYYRSNEFRDLVARLLPEHSLVLAHLIRTAQFIPPNIEVPRVIEMTDAISMNYDRMRSLPQTYSWKKLMYGIEQSRVARYESQALDQFDRAWFVSQVDANFVDGWHRNLEVIPNGVDRARLPFVAGGKGNVIAFLGNIVSVQNQDGCFHFAQNILPLLRARADVRFRVIGNCPDQVRRRLLRIPAVEVTCKFDRIDPHVEGVFCGICSVRAAAGIQNKVLEYLAMGLPCVTTPQGAEGIRLRPGTHAFIYRSEAQAALQIMALYDDAGLRSRTARAGFDLITSHYNWDSLYRRFEGSIADLIAAPSPLSKAG